MIYGPPPTSRVDNPLRTSDNMLCLHLDDARMLLILAKKLNEQPSKTITRLIRQAYDRHIPTEKTTSPISIHPTQKSNQEGNDQPCHH